MLGLLTGDELLAALVAPVEPDFAGGVAVVTDPPRDPADPRLAPARSRLATLPCVVVGHVAHDLVDVVVVDDGELEDVRATVDRTPIAAASLALHLRGSQDRSVEAGLVAESALFSALQAGPEHARWRASRPSKDRGDRNVARIGVERAGDELRITLTRAAARNAIDAAMRDELLAALAVAEADPSIRVVLAGEGPTFCAGGDLDEFGSRPDPATAHVVRLRTSVGAAIHRISPRVTVLMHGASAGSGVELAAFAGSVIAHPRATFALPELSLGLVPGAGGTVSVAARIGRWRAAWLALTGRSIDAATAHRWGLVDRIAR